MCCRRLDLAVQGLQPNQFQAPAAAATAGGGGGAGGCRGPSFLMQLPDDNIDYQLEEIEDVHACLAAAMQKCEMFEAVALSDGDAGGITWRFETQLPGDGKAVHCFKLKAQLSHLKLIHLPEVKLDSD